MIKQKKKTGLCLMIILLFLYGMQCVYTYTQPCDEITIIGYHHIVPDQDKETYYKGNMWVASLSSFEEQMELLYKEGYKSVTLEDVYLWKLGKKELNDKSVVITFDDGFYSSTKFAQPILKKYGFQGSVFVIGSLIDEQRSAYLPNIRQHASLKDMVDQSVLTYYAHSFDLHHKKDGNFKIDTLSKAELVKDTNKESELVSTEYYAYPYGRSNAQIKKVLKAHGTKLAFGFNENRKARRYDDAYALPRFCVNAYTKLDVFKAMLESR